VLTYLRKGETFDDPPVQQRRRALLPQCRAQGGGEPDLVGGLAEQDRTGVPDQAFPVRGDLGHGPTR
jgi:hypothetical protein